MRDYWLTQSILAAVRWGYIVMTLIAIALALWLPKRWQGKLIAVAVVLGIAAILPRQASQEIAQQQEVVDDYKVRLAKAQALFADRCKTAGEKIYRTVDNVEGTYVMRPRNEPLNYGQQFKLDDPYGYAGTGDDYLKLFVRGRPIEPTKIAESIDSSKVVAYRFVETADESGKGFYRYTTSMAKEESEHITRNGGGIVPLSKVHAPSRSAKYGVMWDDISTQEDRENWIAGSSQKIVELETNQVIAERVGYMFDSGLGDTSGGRSPWTAARSNACPPLNEQIFYFFDRVIQPTKGATK